MTTLTAPTRTNGNVQKRNVLPIASVYQTSNYEMFKFLNDNRDLNMLHVHRLVKSFEHRHLLSAITVNEKNEVIDGQHRLEAAKIAGVPIYYMVVPGYGIEEVRILNTNQKNWTKYDFMHMYCQRGKLPYLKIRDFMEVNAGFKLGICIWLLEGGTDEREEINGSKLKSKRFEEGRFVIKDESRAQQIVNRVKDFEPYYKNFPTPAFVKAISTLLRRKKYNHAEMLSKLKTSGMKIVDCDNTEEYLLLLEKIYNYHRAKENKVGVRYAK